MSDYPVRESVYEADPAGVNFEFSFGLTGRRIIDPMLDGERDPIKLAQFRDHRTKSSEEKLAKSLERDQCEGHLFPVRQEYELY